MTDNLDKNIRLIKKQILTKVMNAVEAAAEHLKEEGQRICPVSENGTWFNGVFYASGNLKASAYLTRDDTKKEVAVGYDLEKAPYGLLAHEVVFRPDGSRVYHKPPTQGKFLEQPARTEVEAMRDILRAKLGKKK